MERNYGKFIVSDEYPTGTFGLLRWVWQRTRAEAWHGPYLCKWQAILVGWWCTR